MSQWVSQVLSRLLDGQDMSAEEVRRFLREALSGACGELETSALLVGLRAKGETAGEIAAAASVLREEMIPLEIGRPGLLDTAGTGGDRASTFNISTAAALVAAGAGVAVVKHGNRAVSSRSGSADVLEALGVRIDGTAAFAKQCLDKAGFAFCLATRFHPVLSRLADLRRRLGVWTIFNCLGPLLNPGGAQYQLLGVGRPELLDKLAGALALLGTTRALVVCGSDGLDEVTMSGSTEVREVEGNHVKSRQWTTQDFGLEPCAISDLHADGPGPSAAIIQNILNGENGPAARVVLANAAAALLAAGVVPNLATGVTLAKEAIKSGRARQVLDRLIACSLETAP